MSTKEIPLSGGFATIVDEANYDWLNQWKWHCVKGYAQRTTHAGMANGKQKFGYVQMHRLIMDAPAGMEVDHIDGNRSNNTRSNLRLCTKAENCRNKAKAKNKSSKYKGVSFQKRDGKYKARITINGVCIYLGLFSDEITAAMAYDEHSKKHHGEYGKPNHRLERIALDKTLTN